MKSFWVKWAARLGVLAGAAVVLIVLLRTTGLGRAATWQRLASPGQLSVPHAFLEDNCAACHTAVKGPDATKCIACHAGNESLLARQPTAFHAGVGSCRECHAEHQGTGGRPTVMDHAALARIGLRQLKEGPEGEERWSQEQLADWISRRGAGGRSVPGGPPISPAEAALDCAACHGTKDRHSGLFGRDCAECHSTEKWTIPGFRHPSPRSTDCAQCHQAPPSHYMGHFHMVSAKVAGKPHAKVRECHLCHETTAWNDIKGVGWYKHH